MLRNPFAIKNGRVIVIDDLTESDKGLACGCVCPCCGGDFEARLGNVRAHHFAHNKDGCDEERAFLVGLYKIYKQFLDEENSVLLPGVTLYCILGQVEHITKENFQFYIKRNYTHLSNHRFELSKDGKFKPDNSEIVIDGKGKPEAIIVYKGSKKLAVVIQHPQIGCNPHIVSQYKDMPSLMINLKEMNDEDKKNTDYLYSMFNDISLYSWISENIGLSKLSEIDEINKKKYDANMESEFIEERKRQELAKKLRTENELRKEQARKKEEERKKLELEQIRKIKEEKQKKIEIANEKIEKKMLPLVNFMKKHYAYNNLGEPDIEDMNTRYCFVKSFSDPKNTLGKLEAELCIENGMEPIDHWGQVWLTCKSCGNLIKFVPENEDSIPKVFTTVCNKCKGFR